MEGRGLAALLVVAESGNDPDLAPFVGNAHLGRSFLLAPAAGEACLGYLTAMERREATATGLTPISPAELDLEARRRSSGSESELWAAILARALAIAEVERGAIGLAGHFPAGTIHAACRRLGRDGWSFEPAHDELLELRQTKTAAELDEIRRVAAAVCRAMSRVAAVLASSRRGADGLETEGEPLTAGRLRREIQLVFAEHGVEQPEGNIVASGADAGVPHSQGASDRQIEPGTALVVDLFPRAGLFADCTRTFCVGEPPAELARAHRTVVEVLEEARAAVRPGRHGLELQRLACQRFEGAGYPTARSDPATTVGYVHGLGHGVGYELHEYPSFRERRDATAELGIGNVFTLEPGLYDPEAGWGVRVEDLCHLRADGLEVLTPLPYDLDPRAWH